jgi:transposase, IS30 family
VLLNQGKTKYAIAGILKVDKSTITREVKNRGGILRGYTAKYAQDDYRRQKLKGGAQKKIDNPIIASFVIDKIKQGWSPETISGRLKKQIKEKETLPELYINHESIYRFVFDSDYGKREKLCNYLRQGKKRRTKRHGRKTKHEIIPNRVFIDNRPTEVDTRLTVGHWEGDAIIYKNKQAIQSIVERKLRYAILTKLNRKTVDETTTAFVNGLDNYYVQSLTLDNGSENRNHEIIADKLNIDVYYCHPYHSWEKGTNENTNGLVRRYLPRGISIVDVSQDDLNDIAWELNNRPRKILGYATPQEMLELEYSKLLKVKKVAIEY